jgi:Transposase zinc-binding domain/Putative transposase
VAKATAEYTPRRPGDSLVHRMVAEHLETFLETSVQGTSAPLPDYVIESFRGFLDCGVFERGFIRCHCDACGHDVLVPFSCKKRGPCSSCSSRRMAEEAAQVVDRVVPNVPLRQWVLSFPFPISVLAAKRHEVLKALGNIFAEEIARCIETAAARPNVATGTISFVQRFGSSLNLHVHLHVMCPDALFERRQNVCACTKFRHRVRKR